MINLFIGNYENVIGKTGYIKEGENYISCKIIGYLFKSRKYQVETQDGRSRSVQRVYIND